MVAEDLFDAQVADEDVSAKNVEMYRSLEDKAVAAEADFGQFRADVALKYGQFKGTIEFGEVDGV